MEVENINSREKLVISSSRTTRYLGYPRKVPLWELEFILPEECKLIRNNDNSDISLEIENCKGKAFVPALSKKESIRCIHCGNNHTSSDVKKSTNDSLAKLQEKGIFQQSNFIRFL